MLVVHWIACGFHVIPDFEQSLGWQEVRASGSVSWLDEQELDAAGPRHRFLASAYYAVTTITTVGYGTHSRCHVTYASANACHAGDIHPITPLEQAYGILVMALGAIFYSSLFASMTNLIASLNISYVVLQALCLLPHRTVD